MDITSIISGLEIKEHDNVFIYLPSTFLNFKRIIEFELKKHGVDKIVFHEVDMNREKAMIDYLDIENIYKYPLFDYSDFNKYAKLGYKFVIFNVDRYKLYSYLDKEKIDNTIKHIESTKEFFNNCLENNSIKIYIHKED